MKCPVCHQGEMVSGIKDIPYTFRGRKTVLKGIHGLYCVHCEESIMNKEESSQSEVTHMTKTVSTSKKPRKQHSPEFRSEALKLAERIGVTAAARELSLYESQLYNWRSKQQNQQTSSERELEMSTEIARLKSWPYQ